MADTVKVDIQGAKELEKLLLKLPPRVSKKHMRRAVNQSTAILRKDMRNRAPFKTGRLRRNIKSRGRRGGRHYLKASVFIQVGERRQKHDISSGQFLSGSRDFRHDPKDAFYWRFLERGTRFMRARPFIRPSIDANFPRVVRNVISETNRGVRAEIAAQRTKK